MHRIQSFIKQQYDTEDAIGAFQLLMSFYYSYFSVFITVLVGLLIAVPVAMMSIGTYYNFVSF